MTNITDALYETIDALKYQIRELNHTIMKRDFEIEQLNKRISELEESQKQQSLL